jgi:glycosyltransferase involved in cell wall biosynthesis
MRNQNKTIRILHISDALPDYHLIWGGAEKIAYRQIKLSTELNNFEIFVAGTKPIKLVKENFYFFPILTIENLLPKKIARLFFAFKNQIFPFDLISFFHLIFIFLKIKPNIIHLHKTSKISLTPIVVAKIFKIPVILATYDYWYFCPNRLLIDKEGNPCYRFQGPWCKNCSSLEGRFLLKFLSLFRKKIFNFFLLKVDRFSVLSESCRDLVAKYLGSKNKIYLVSQLSINKEDNHSLSVEPNSIFFNTWMLPHKGVDVVIKALAEVVKKIPQTKLYLAIKDAGNYSNYRYYQEIMRLIEKLNLKDKVIFIEKPDHQMYLNLLKKANVVVVAEQWENMVPTTLVDAMSFGKAIVASKIGGIPEIIEDTGFLVEPKDYQNFAKKIIEILSNKSLAEKLGKKAQERIKKYGLKEMVKEELFKLYQF